MKKYLWVFSILIGFLSRPAFSQEEQDVEAKTRRKLAKQERLALKQAEEKAVAKMVDSLIMKRKFVLEADFLSNQRGSRVNVNHLLNFIIVDSSKIVIQIASTTGIGGPNGMGGITTDGNISAFEVTKTGRKKDTYHIRLLANTSIGPYDIYLNVSPSSGTDATISGIRAGRLNYHGKIKPLEKSRVYKGMSI